ncbi:alpha/beta fold hydrolase [Terrilactibacillus sp. BCM23-1]|uniref:Alpha/beta fold hydrolase n=1 Tax=Terrilactibacillus tamarindi TaxID=2599694 RepID=A0A6N8CQ05_9BACI|nr:alpha/beta hydrolase [Terrilactibacillus tamarindi]MTT31720.1 alpha/beta fold hydrolase [Terrilactibacillus tamarindi]
MPFIKTNDGTKIYYEEQGSGQPLVMIHGWGFSGRFFHRNVPALAEHARVITIDLRGHGNSDKPSHGYRVPRLARDLYDVLSTLNLNHVTVLGWSLGCPVIWSYFELFGKERIRQAIFVEQSPRQYYALDWKYAHATCYDDASLAYTQAQVTLDTSNFDKNQINTIMATMPTIMERELFLSEMAKAPAFARNAIMADHTRYDWRDLLPRIDLPSLVLVACKDKVFPWQGPAYVGEHIPNAQTVFFENSSHALFLDEPEKFNESVIHFMSNNTGGIG